MDDDDIDEAAFLAALDAPELSHKRQSVPEPSRPSATGGTTTSSASKVKQPVPQALPSRSTPAAILVSPRQKGNPILTHIRSLPWEYSDIPADYVLGATTCALFLSLKYHRLHPEYIYTRIRALQGKYNLRVILTMIDIQNHEDSLKELSKTSLVNNVTIMLCWSAVEAARYLELFKSYEHANPSSIRVQQSTSYADRMVDFVTVPRSINKTDALGLVSAFGSIRTAINAPPEEVALVAGWGEKKVRRWCGVVGEPFRVRKAAKRGLKKGDGTKQDGQSRLDVAARLGIGAAIPIDIQEAPPSDRPETSTRPLAQSIEDFQMLEPDEDEEEALAAAFMEESTRGQKMNESTTGNHDASHEGLSEGVMSALAKLRNAN
jgi:DNA excision repair protein ERCC-1